MNKPRISIIILTRSSERLPKIFEALERQSGAPAFEVIVIDSRSRDGSWKFLLRFARSFPLAFARGQDDKAKMKNGNQSPKTENSCLVRIRSYCIKPCQFGHGRTRNLAVRKCKGEIVVFLTDDAMPKDTNWLARLTAPLSDRNMAAVFGRQIPYKESSISERFSYLMAYPDCDRIIKKDDIQRFSAGHLLYSNVNGAIKKELLLRFPFDEKVVMSEDHWWAKDILGAGYKICYLRGAAVYHSHNYSLSQLFCRNFTSGYSLRGFGGLGLAESIKQGTSYIKKEISYLGYLRSLSILNILGIFVYEGVRVTGFLLGKKGGLLPAGIRRKLMVAVAGFRIEE